jgi:hypothetical protein
MIAVKSFARAFCAAAFFFAAAPVAAQTSFITGLNDVPLMPGLVPLGETLVFDKPGGRIAEAVFTSRQGADAVARFYADTLPQLGWRAAGKDRYVRDREELALHLSGSAVRVVLQPKK